MSRTYTADTLKLMALFESVTRAQLKDCFVDKGDQLTFVVAEPEMGKAIGKHAANVKRLEELLKRRVKILAWSDDPEQFFRNLVYPLAGFETELQDGKLLVKGQDSRTKGLLIGREQANLKNSLHVMQKYFKLESIKVI